MTFYLFIGNKTTDLKIYYILLLYILNSLLEKNSTYPNFIIVDYYYLRLRFCQMSILS